MSVFLPLLNTNDDDLVAALARIGPIIVDAAAQSGPDTPPQYPTYVLLDYREACNIDKIVSLLDSGVEKVIVPLAWAPEFAGVLPPERLLLLLDVGSVSAVSDQVRESVSGVFLKAPAVDSDLLQSISRFFANSDIFVYQTSSTPPTASFVRELKHNGATTVIPTSQLTLSPTSPSALNITDAFLSALTTDRADGLFATVVSSWPQGGKSLGLVYSSAESIKEAILTGIGVYYSRRHGLWRKGETSGDTQAIVSIRVDCDCDCLEFSVIQHGKGFCHLSRPSCFGGLSGLAALEKTLQSRKDSAPEGSYTRRLFNDQDLLRSKIMEEADELCRAQTKEEVAFEAADLLYFALTRCVSMGVNIADIERSLDRKAKKVTRRPGNAKPQWSTSSKSANGKPSPTPAKEDSDVSGPIRMRTVDVSATSATERLRLLKRPTLNSSDMIAKVKPIVDAVRQRGDAALLELTEKFDKARLKSCVIRPPFSPDSMQLDDSVKQAIETAYTNIWKFHEAQADKSTLTVETMPGVVCQRFARPIARVGLYVPGGTAILPSTALMLGIPAQVAGCKEIVLATPPQANGTVSPEVMYVANLVGASAILLAGGAQAVAALAYGTESVPKVDKIFGPGNQWVTAAKMLVQNDTDALVSIDMPAGPSEVLVIADHTANAAYVAADLLSQAEHGIDSQVVLVAIDLTAEHLADIEKEVDAQARALPRVDILRQSIVKSLIVKVPCLEDAIAFSNDYAPEHLILHLAAAKEAVANINNAGSIFIGPFTPESCGDYASGTNHTLPTNGYARQFSGVNTNSFQKHLTAQEITREGLQKLGPVVATLADCEGLQAHANAVRIRLRSSTK